VRYVAGEALVAGGDGAIERLKKLAASADAISRARAISLLARLDAAAVESMLADTEPAIRIAAFRALRSLDRDVLPYAKRLVDDSSPVMRREVAVALRDVPLEQSRDLIVNLAKHYDGRDRQYLEAIGIACDGKEAAIYPLLVGSEDPSKWSAATAGLAWRLHPAASIAAFASRAASTDLSPEARQQALVALAFIKDSAAADAMAKLAGGGVAETRASADWWLRNRASNDWEHFEAARRFVETAPADPALAKQRQQDRKTLLDPKATRRERRQVAGRMAADREGGMFLVSLANEGKLPHDVVDAVTGPIYRNPDLGVRALASKYFPRQTTSGIAMPSVTELATMKGDAARGRDIFFGNTASCSRCHAFNGDGKDVGPELTTIRTKFAKPELLDAILNPSANIAIGFEPWIIKTTKSEVFGGFIIADGESVVLKESSGEKKTFAKKDIKSRTRQTMSVMPDNVAMGLSAQELADVAEFLLKAPVKK
jgi:putative heme-binding domain-containing protein